MHPVSPPPGRARGRKKVKNDVQALARVGRYDIMKATSEDEGQSAFSLEERVKLARRLGMACPGSVLFRPK
jgi:hypothetical protein